LSITSWKNIGEASARYLHGHGGDEDVAEGRLLLEDFGDEPAQAERLVGVGQLVLAFDEQHLAVPARQIRRATSTTMAVRRHCRIEHGDPSAPSPAPPTTMTILPSCRRAISGNTPPCCQQAVPGQLV
jgi:hypothetical protein